MDGDELKKNSHTLDALERSADFDKFLKIWLAGWLLAGMMMRRKRRGSKEF